MYALVQLLRSTDHRFGHHVGLNGAVFGQEATGETVNDTAYLASDFFSKTVLVAFAQQHGGAEDMDAPEGQLLKGFFQFTFDFAVKKP